MYILVDVRLPLGIIYINGPRTFVFLEGLRVNHLEFVVLRRGRTRAVADFGLRSGLRVNLAYACGIDVRYTSFIDVFEEPLGNFPRLRICC
jgi:hypothetical protein